MNGPLPYKNLELVSIIDEVDFPILSHYNDDMRNDILQYFLGYTNNHLLSLSWKVREIDLFNYLNNRITLRELITDDSKEFLYFHKSLHDLYEYIPPKNIPEDFLPDGNSYYGFPIPDKYEYLFSKFSGDSYVAALHDRGVVLNISPKGSRYKHTVSLEDVADMTSQISNSIKSFVDQKFYSSFKSTISDIKTFETTRKKVLKRATPRVCDSRFGSFEITISNDRIFDEGLESKFRDWSNEILTNYENQVLYVDYSNPDVVKSILETHSIAEIKTIYEPFINTIAQKNFILSARTIGTDKSIAFTKDYRTTKKEVRRKVTTIKEINNPTSKKKLVHLVLEIEADQDVQNLNKSQINKDLVVSYETDTFSFRIDELIRGGERFIFVEPLEFELEIDENSNYWVEHLLFPESVFIEDKTQIMEELTKAINDIIDIYHAGNVNDFLTKYNLHVS